MTISVYADLKAAIERFLDDNSVTSSVADFIELAESAIIHDKETRFLAGEIRATASTDSGSQYLTVPAGFKRIKRMHIVGDPQKNVQIVSRSILNEYYTSATGKPSYVSLIGDQFEFDRIPDTTYTVEIVADKLTALSDSSTTNEIFPEYVDLYLYGSLIHAAIFVKDIELYSLAKKEYASAVYKASLADKSARFGGSVRARPMVTI